jgi:cytoskeletal protein RodZ
LPYLLTTPSNSKISAYHNIAPKYHAHTITMSDSTFHTTTQDTRKAESKVAQSHHGNPPADSDVSKMKSVIDQNTNKPAEIEKTKANLPLPDQPQVASDFNSLDQRTTGVGSGRFEFPPDNSGLREGAAASSSARVDGNEMHKTTAP